MLAAVCVVLLCFITALWSHRTSNRATEEERWCGSAKELVPLLPSSEAAADPKPWPCNAFSFCSILRMDVALLYPTPNMSLPLLFRILLRPLLSTPSPRWDLRIITYSINLESREGVGFSGRTFPPPSLSMMMEAKSMTQLFLWEACLPPASSFVLPPFDGDGGRTQKIHHQLFLQLVCRKNIHLWGENSKED